MCLSKPARVTDNRKGTILLQNLSVNYDSVIFYGKGPWGLYCKTFYGRNLRIFVTSLPNYIRQGWRGLPGRNTSLLRKSVNYGSKFFYSTGPWFHPVSQSLSMIDDPIVLYHPLDGITNPKNKLLRF